MEDKLHWYILAVVISITIIILQIKENRRMSAKKQIYIAAELDWAEEKLMEWREYIDANPIIELEDRIKLKETKNGGAIPMVIASIEQQIKSIRDTMKEYLILLQEVNKMREADEKQKVARGGSEVPHRMK